MTLLYPAKNWRYSFAVIALLLFLSSGCKHDIDPEGDNLILFNYFSMPIPELSGLSFYKEEGKLLTVSDMTGRVYIISTDGYVLDSLPYKGKDPEGVTYDQVTGRIFIVEEKDNEVVELDTLGNVINRFKVDLGNIFPKHGLEGITINTKTGNLLVVSEKFPGLLIELTKTGTELSRYELNFALDYSSVFYDPRTDMLWILSDESKTLTSVTLKGEKVRSWNTGIEKGEGLVIDSEKNLIYIVNDGKSALFVLKMRSQS